MAFFGSRSSGTSSGLIAFYEGTGPDHRGRSLSDILRWNASKLEASHDYIQTVFPLPEESGVNWDAPIIDREVFNAFRSRPELREKLRESFQKILWFYGLKLETEDAVKVVKGDNFSENAENWDCRFDHNHLRITRIIRCLRVLGLEDEALAFHAALKENSTHVGPKSREFWRRAAKRSLNIRPDLDVDDELDHNIGPKFLREFEEQRRKKETEVEKNSESTEDSTSATPDKKVEEVDSHSAGDKFANGMQSQTVEENSDPLEGEADSK